MIKYIIWIVLLSNIVVSCTPNDNVSQEEMLAETIASIVEQEMALTPSKIPPTAISPAVQTETPTETPKVEVTINTYSNSHHRYLRRLSFRRVWTLRLPGEYKPVDWALC